MENLSKFNSEISIVNKNIRISQENSELKKNLLPPIDKKNNFLGASRPGEGSSSKKSSNFSKKFSINSLSVNQSKNHLKKKSIAGDIRSILRQNNSANKNNYTKLSNDECLLPSCIKFEEISIANKAKVKFFCLF
jgi:hypothetical protein